MISADFEDGLQGWVPRATDDRPGHRSPSPTTDAHGGAQSALLTERTSQGHGIGFDATGVLIPGTSYEYSAWVRFAPGQTVDDIWLSLARTVGGSTSYDTLKQFTGMSNSEWVQVTGTFQMAAADSALLYFETPWENGATRATRPTSSSTTSWSRSRTRCRSQDLTPIKDTVDFPVGAAIDSREQTGAQSELLLRHFDQVTSENYMKPEAWYDADEALHAAPRGRRDHARTRRRTGSPCTGTRSRGTARRRPGSSRTTRARRSRRARPTSRSSRTGCGRTSTPSPST